MLLRAWNAPGTDACARSPAACCAGPQAGRGGRFLRNRNRPQFGRQDRTHRDRTPQPQGQGPGMGTAAGKVRPEKPAHEWADRMGRSAASRCATRTAGHSSTRPGAASRCWDKRGRGRRHEWCGPGADASHRRAGGTRRAGRARTAQSQTRRARRTRGAGRRRRCATRTEAQ